MPTLNASTATRRHNPASSRPQQHTPGFKAVLVSEAAYGTLKAIQNAPASGATGIDAIRYDLKDIVTAFVQEAALIPGFGDRVLARARNTLISSLQQPTHLSTHQE